MTEKMYRGLASADTMMASAGGVILDRRATAPQNQTINLTGGGLVSEVDRQLPPARPTAPFWPQGRLHEFGLTALH